MDNEELDLKLREAVADSIRETVEAAMREDDRHETEEQWRAFPLRQDGEEPEPERGGKHLKIEDRAENEPEIPDPVPETPEDGEVTEPEIEVEFFEEPEPEKTEPETDAGFLPEKPLRLWEEETEDTPEEPMEEAPETAAPAGRKKLKGGTLLAVFLAAFLLFLLIGLLPLNGKLNRLSRGEERESVSVVEMVQNLLPGSEEGQIVNILFIGSDMRIPYTEDIGRGDVTMICSLNKKTGGIKLASIERGTAMPWEGHGDVMITSYYRYNGALATQEVVERMFQVDLDGYAHVDFDSFRDIVDAVGGVDIELSDMEAMGVNMEVNGWPYQAGVNHLDGEAALAFCRLRNIDDNWNRTGRQRRTIQAILTKSRDLNLSELNELADVVLPMIDTNLSNSEITGLLLAAGKFSGAQIEQMVLPDKDKTWGDFGYEGVNRCDYEYESQRLHEFLYGEA